jgi:hypothetical protein
VTRNARRASIPSTPNPRGSFAAVVKEATPGVAAGMSASDADMPQSLSRHPLYGIKAAKPTAKPAALFKVEGPEYLSHSRIKATGGNNGLRDNSESRQGRAS